MKTLTKNFLIFTLLFLLGTVVFRMILSYALQNDLSLLVWVSSVLYFICNLLIGWFTGRRDYDDIPFYDLGLRYHGMSYFIFVLISELWFYFGFNSPYESIITLRYIEVFWGLGLLLHFIAFFLTRKNSFKGLNREEIFE